MTTPMVDTVRTIPLIIERDFEPMEAEIDSGFPFDRDDHFRSQLDDIAQRHPEFAEHLEGFNRRPPSNTRSRLADRVFGSGGVSSHFGPNFPFDEEEIVVSPTKQEEQQTQQQFEEKPKERSRNKNIQPSNTVDLGQKQEPVNDRNQRSMSAPPSDNRQRYVSSIHIPINREGGMGDMGQAQAQPHHPNEKPINKPTERVIPIHVEGRDEPVLPKNATFTQQATAPPPQPERIFGHSPSHFTQFVGREAPRQDQEWQIPVQKVAPQQKQQPQNQKPQQQQQQSPQPQPQHQEELPKQEQPPPQKSCTSTNPIEIIQSIQKDVGELMAQVEKFTGVPKDKQYVYLDEMLTRNLLKLDDIDTQGQENIRQARKEAIKCIQTCINILEAKAAANLPQEPKKETDQQQQQQAATSEDIKMEVEEKKEEVEQQQQQPPKEETKMETDVAPTSDDKMEVEPKQTIEEVKETTNNNNEEKKE